VIYGYHADQIWSIKLQVFMNDSATRYANQQYILTTLFMFMNIFLSFISIQCFDTVGWATGRASGL